MIEGLYLTFFYLLKSLATPIHFDSWCREWCRRQIWRESCFYINMPVLTVVQADAKSLENLFLPKKPSKFTQASNEMSLLCLLFLSAISVYLLFYVHQCTLSSNWLKKKGKWLILLWRHHNLMQTENKMPSMPGYIMSILEHDPMLDHLHCCCRVRFSTQKGLLQHDMKKEWTDESLFLPSIS